MTIPRIYIEKDKIEDNLIIADKDAFHKISHVLRSKKGDKLIFFDGSGTEYETIAESFSKNLCTCKIITKKTHSYNETNKFSLLLGILKKDKMESSIEKAVQLGVSEIIPLKCERTQVKINNGKEEEKKKRWEKIAIEACALSRRVYVPKIFHPLPVNEALPKIADANRKILLWEREQKRMKDILHNKIGKKNQKIVIAIGPEGGFTESEAKSFMSSGFISASLGDHILSADTAVIYALSILKYLTE
ncbi:MAG: 16S rRNA (uracil(1498)-N(3))-methyltransferase [Candidatus Schekmanbacteria bacterium]|nr:MAG: 16S rRNA (uracil(1498)-N(3))-methyltransferase [Candidatus Schekmanbacteria bacterium]